jgi:hypothetical protein
VLLVLLVLVLVLVLLVLLLLLLLLFMTMAATWFWEGLHGMARAAGTATDAVPVPCPCDIARSRRTRRAMVADLEMHRLSDILLCQEIAQLQQNDKFHIDKRAPSHSMLLHLAAKVNMDEKVAPEMMVLAKAEHERQEQQLLQQQQHKLGKSSHMSLAHLERISRTLHEEAGHTDGPVLVGRCVIS